MDLSSEWELNLESGDLILDLSGHLECLVVKPGFATDLLFLGSFSEKSSKDWLRSAVLNPWIPETF